ncbi:MAG: hypothetical protein PHI32_10285 [Dysgonamonadaceae bacterium]|nr:hypothetical protein [Dysgonamonadaceae bacterium]MDD4727231.1 hypothetical protein [Dysgonamonadaceae bacterium]
MNSRNLILLFSFFIILGTSCINSQNSSDKDKLADEGWFLKKTNGETEKFFPIGAWNIPGYVAEDANSTDVYNKQSRNINISFHHIGQQRKDIMYMSIRPSYILMGFLSKMPVITSKGKEKGYYEGQYLKNIENDKELLTVLDDELHKHVLKYENVERAYLPIDEVSMGLAQNHWYTPPVVGEVIYKKLQTIDPNTIVFADLAGHGKGSSFFFEKRYLKEHSSMPETPPYEMTNESAQEYAKDALAKGEGFPLLAFNEGFNGVPAYEFKDNSYSYTSYTPEELKSYHYENIKAYAEAYKGNGNAFGINAFMDFRDNPVLAGTTVDAIRAGLGDPKVPIWLFFDGNGYAKPGNISAEDYVNQVKCQMYTSIIHGATGVFFWNDSRKTAEVWDALQPTLEEMKSNLDIFKLKTLEKRDDGDMHLMIKQDEKGKKYIMASNTSKTNNVPLEVENVEKNNLAPLEVYVSPI